MPSPKALPNESSPESSKKNIFNLIFSLFFFERIKMGAKKILMIAGDFAEDYEVMVPSQAL